MPLAQTAERSSMLYSFFPSIVKSRLPKLPSLRSSIGIIYRSTSGSQSPILESGARTPETDNESAMVLSGGKRVALNEYFTEAASLSEDLSETGRTTSPQVEVFEDKSGIQWKFANQGTLFYFTTILRADHVPTGLSLLSLVVQESSIITQEPRFGNAAFARQLYLHAITYLLRALPTDLTMEEQLSVRSALPEDMVEPLHLIPRGDVIEPVQPIPSRQPSLVHRTLASFIIWMFIVVQFLFPYFKLFLRSAYQYEREHKISEKVFSQSMDTVDTLGKRGVSLTETIYGMGNGKVGQVLNGTASWLVEGVTGGIHEGVGEGMAMMSARRATAMEGL